MQDSQARPPAVRSSRALFQFSRRSAVSLLIASAVSLAGCASVDAHPSLARRVDTILEPLVAAHEFTGAVVLSRAGNTLYQRGFGLANHAAGVLNTPDTPADGASLAKTFTAAGVWLLVQGGLIELDAPVTLYVPEFPHARTTVRHLLIHSNGLPADYAFFDPYFEQDQVRTTRDMLQVVATHAPEPGFEPGSRFEYSSLGFDVAALVIERVTGKSYEAFLRQTFFTPLGMKQSFARPARLADWMGIRTLGYRWLGGAWQPFDVYDMEAFLGGSNLYFSASDLGRWADAHAMAAALPESVRASGQRRALIGGKPSAITGLSWYCDDAAVRCYYTGSLNAFHSFVYWDGARRESVAFVSNSSLPPWQTITLQRALVDALAGWPRRVETRESFATFTADTQSSAAGEYFAEGFGVVSVAEHGGRLTLRANCGLEVDMFQVARDVFYVPGTDYWIAFGAGSQPVAMFLRSMFVDTVLDRRPDHTPGSASPCTSAPIDAANLPSWAE